MISFLFSTEKDNTVKVVFRSVEEKMEVYDEVVDFWVPGVSLTGEMVL